MKFMHCPQVVVTYPILKDTDNINLIFRTLGLVVAVEPMSMFKNLEAHIEKFLWH